MIPDKLIAVVAITGAYFGASCLNAAAIPARTILMVRTVSSVSSNDPVGRTFAAQLEHDVDVKGKVLLKAGTKAFGKIKSSRSNPRRSEPLSLQLTLISVNGRSVAVKTNSVQPVSPQRTAQQARHGFTAGTLVATLGIKMQFPLAAPVNL